MVRVKIDDDGKHIVMDDGTRHYAFSGIIGLDPEDMQITYGNDGWVGEFDTLLFRSITARLPTS